MAASCSHHPCLAICTSNAKYEARYNITVMPELDLLNGRLKLRHLVLVTAIADQGSVLRAAEQLRLAQPAVTRSLREVEQILGVELFERGPRGCTPSMFGVAFLEHARTVLAELRLAG